MKKLYAMVDEDVETTSAKYEPRKFVPPAKVERPEGTKTLENWPLAASAAKALQGADARMELDLGGGEKIAFVRIPAGRFLMGSAVGEMDEAPRSAVAIGKAFWMSEKEVTNGTYGLFDPKRDRNH